MTAPDLIHHYGYAAIAVGTCFEGEMIVLAAGVAVSAGYLGWAGALASGMAGIFVSDTFCFLLGRFAGARLARWFPGLHRRLDGAFQLIERHQEKLIVFFQFFPGMCTVTPVAFGLSRIPVGRFLLFDLAGNAIWTLSFCVAGYAGGSALIQAFAGLPLWVPLCGWAAGAGTIAWLVLRRRRESPPARISA
jgi:membrane protein DedA with SNARE-associated domain